MQRESTCEISEDGSWEPPQVYLILFILAIVRRYLQLHYKDLFTASLTHFLTFTSVTKVPEVRHAHLINNQEHSSRRLRISNLEGTVSFSANPIKYAD